jgi:hypothetical protein
MSSGWVGPLARSRFVAVAGAYVLGIAVAATLVAGGAYRLAVALIGEPVTQTSADRPATQLSQHLAKQAPFSRIPPAVSQTVIRNASMLPLQDRWYGAQRYPDGMPFGSSSRGGWRSPFDRGRERGWGDDDEDQRPQYGATFRTVCVRLCDGYYFPVSFAVTPDRLERDAQVCTSRCGNQGRLFVHNNPGGSAEDMVDLAGRPYQQLKTAFLYRTEYVPSCKCQPDPWETAAQDRHRVYALAVAVSKGNRDAVKELQALQAKVKQAATVPDQAGVLPAAGPDAARPSERAAEIARRDGESFMRLGGSDAPKTRTDPPSGRAWDTPRSDPAWMKRAFSPPGG